MPAEQIPTVLNSHSDLRDRLREIGADDPDALAQRLANDVAERLRSALDARGTALLAVSGGSTPRPFLHALAQIDLHWSRVCVTLVDERWVPEDHPRSNARLLRETLLQNAAKQAQFISLYVDTVDPESGLPIVAERLARLALPFDAVVLGMGDDGHVASLFPGVASLPTALDPHGTARVMAIRAAAAPEARISLSLSCLLDTRAMQLHMLGRHKREVLSRALNSGATALDYPVRAVVEHARNQVDLYWCP